MLQRPEYQKAKPYFLIFSRVGSLHGPEITVSLHSIRHHAIS